MLICDLNSIKDGGIFETNYINIYLEYFELGKENTDKHEASFFNLDIKVRDGKFQADLFHKIDLFHFSLARLPDKSSNVPSNIVNTIRSDGNACFLYKKI